MLLSIDGEGQMYFGVIAIRGMVFDNIIVNVLDNGMKDQLNGLASQ
jgi:hypothetical protein